MSEKVTITFFLFCGYYVNFKYKFQVSHSEIIHLHKLPLILYFIQYYLCTESESDIIECDEKEARVSTKSEGMWTQKTHLKCLIIPGNVSWMHLGITSLKTHFNTWCKQALSLAHSISGIMYLICGPLSICRRIPDLRERWDVCNLYIQSTNM